MEENRGIRKIPHGRNTCVYQGQGEGGCLLDIDANTNKSAMYTNDWSVSYFHAGLPIGPQFTSEHTFPICTKAKHT